MRAEPAATALARLLEEERSAILSGRFADLEPLGLRKRDLLSALADSDEPAPTLARLGARVAQNQRLLAAAIAGLRDGARRLSAIREAAAGFRSYDRDGARADVTAAVRPGFERKA